MYIGSLNSPLQSDKIVISKGLLLKNFREYLVNLKKSSILSYDCNCVICQTFSFIFLVGVVHFLSIKKISFIV